MAIRFQSPSKECDLVMKGGITSGIIYPPAVLRLAETYRFRCVGGASAGALAAALTAAAEYGRERGGFEKLEAAGGRLRDGRFLRNLFQPSEPTRPLFETLLAMAEFHKSHAPGDGSPLKVLVQWLKVFVGVLQRSDATAFAGGARRGLACGLLLGAAIAGLAFLVFYAAGGAPSGGGFAVFLLLLGIPLAWLGRRLGAAAGGLLDLWVILTHKVPENFFGLCSGRPQPGPDWSSDALTDWFCAQIDHLSGIDAGPLTFGALRQKSITLKMVTSNLSQNQPYELPFERTHFIFDERDFSGLFPDLIVRHLIDRAYTSSRTVLPNGFHYMPDPDDLPVAVAARLSLSFPVLIGAVPLYTIHREAFNRRTGSERLTLRVEDLQKNWFSDGGIACNFPIHFFDAWLPQRPTFGIKLTSLPAQAFRDNGAPADRVRPEYLATEDPSSDTSDKATPATDAVSAPEDSADAPDPDEIYDTVFLPQANHPLSPEWIPLTEAPLSPNAPAAPSLPKFLWAIFSTAQNYRDNAQSMLPSYRERVVQIRLREDEGGLNLAMDRQTIARVLAKGDRAGQVLLDEFNFDHHQWVRFRVLMAELEDKLLGMEAVLRDEHFNCQRLAEAQVLSRTLDDRVKRYPYPRDTDWCTKALERITKMRDLARAWEPPVFNQSSPQPKPVLRVTPKL